MNLWDKLKFTPILQKLPEVKKVILQDEDGNISTVKGALVEKGTLIVHTKRNKK